MSHLDDGMLEALLDGETGSSDLASIQAHLEQCAACQARLAEARQFLVEADRLIEMIEAPARPVAAAPTAQAPARRIPRTRLRWAGPLGLAAAAVLALGIGSVTLARFRGSDQDALSAPVFPGAVTTPAQKAVAPTAMPAPPAQSNAAPAPATPRRLEQMRAAPEALGRVSTERQTADARRSAAKAADQPVDKEPKPAAPPIPFRDSALHLDEIVVAGAEQAAGKTERERRGDSSLAISALKLRSAPSPILRKEEADRLNEPFASHDKKATIIVTADDALRTLGGSIKLVDGLMPRSFELVADRIRVIYPMSWGPLVLEEWRQAGELRYRLIPPAGMSADSLAVLAARIR
ncbi:MAG: zf-HC2 domain-containing protein [Gemmatimonadota bacterium]